MLTVRSCRRMSVVSITIFVFALSSITSAVVVPPRTISRVLVPGTSKLTKRDGFTEACRPKLGPEFENVNRPGYNLKKLYELLEICQQYRLDSGDTRKVKDWDDVHDAWPIGSVYCYLYSLDTDIPFQQFQTCLKRVETVVGSTAVVDIKKLNEALEEKDGERVARQKNLMVVLEAPKAKEEAPTLEPAMLKGSSGEFKFGPESDGENIMDRNKKGLRKPGGRANEVDNSEDEQEEMFFPALTATIQNAAKKNSPTLSDTAEQQKYHYPARKPEPSSESEENHPEIALITMKEEFNQQTYDKLLPPNVAWDAQRRKSIIHEGTVHNYIINKQGYAGTPHKYTWILPQFGDKTEQQLITSITPEEALEIWRILHNEQDRSTRQYYTTPYDFPISSEVDNHQLPVFVEKCWKDQYGWLLRSLSWMWRKLRNSIWYNKDEEEFNQEMDNKRRTKFLVCVLQKTRADGGPWTSWRIGQWLKGERKEKTGMDDFLKREKEDLRKMGEMAVPVEDVEKDKKVVNIGRVREGRVNGIL